MTLYRAVGCRHCNQMATAGASAYLNYCNRPLRYVGWSRAVPVMTNCAVRRSYQGMLTLRQSGWQRVLAGETTIAEVAAVATSELE